MYNLDNMFVLFCIRVFTLIIIKICWAYKLLKLCAGEWVTCQPYKSVGSFTNWITKNSSIGFPFTPFRYRCLPIILLYTYTMISKYPSIYISIYVCFIIMCYSCNESIGNYSQLFMNSVAFGLRIFDFYSYELP